MSGIGVITNPRSRANRKNPHLAKRLGYILGERGQLEQPADLDALDATAAHFRERDIDILCVNGGDGTLHKAMTAMCRAYGDAPLPKVAILRGGTMNTIAKGMGIFGRPAELLDAVVDAYHQDRPLPTVHRWVLRVDDHYGFLFGTGVMARYLAAYYEGSEPSPTKAAWVLAQAVASALVGGKFARSLVEPEPLVVHADGTPWHPQAYVSVGAGTVDDVGLGFRPFYLAPAHPGHMHAVGMATSLSGVVRSLPTIWRAREPADPDIVGQVAKTLVLESDSPIQYMLDGDVFTGGRRVELTVSRVVEFIQLDLRTLSRRIGG